MHDADDCISRQVSNGLNSPTGIFSVGAHFPHLGRSPYGAALLSHTEKQHRDCCPEKSSLANLLNAIMSLPLLSAHGLSQSCHFVMPLWENLMQKISDAIMMQF